MEQQPTTPPKRRWPLIIIGVAAVAFIGFCLCLAVLGALAPDGDNERSSPEVAERAAPTPTTNNEKRLPVSTPTPTATPAASQEPTAVPTVSGSVLVGLNEEVKATEWALKVTEVEQTSSLEWEGRRLDPVGQWVIVWAEVRNLTTESTLLSGSDFKLTTPELTGEIKPNKPATRAATAMRYGQADSIADFLGMLVQPGNSQTIAVAFDVPPAAVELMLHLGDDAGTVNLGQVDSIAVLPTPPTTATPVPTDTPKPTPLPQVGDTVAMDGITWRLISAENIGKVLSSDNQFIEPLKTSGTFIKVIAEVTNTGTDPLTVNPFKLIDNAGREYDSADDQWFYIPEDRQCILSNLNPGLTLTCENIYEVPNDASGLAAIVSNLKLFGSETQISLSTLASSPTSSKPGTEPVANREANLRAGPSTSFNSVGKVSVGQVLDLVATNETDDWYKLATGEWIAGFLVDNAPKGLPIAEASEVSPTAALTAEQYLPLLAHLFIDVKIYYGEGSTKTYGFQAVGGSEDCPSMPSGRGVLVRYPDGKTEWKDRMYLVESGLYFVRMDDPEIDSLQWAEIPGCP